MLAGWKWDVGDWAKEDKGGCRAVVLARAKTGFYQVSGPLIGPAFRRHGEAASVTAAARKANRVLRECVRKTK